MAAQDSHGSPVTNLSSRPARKRTLVPTYNLKKLSGNARHTRTCYLRDNTSNNKQIMSPAQASLRALNTTHHLQRADSGTSSPLSSLLVSPSPLTSSRISTPDAGLQDTATAASLEFQITMNSSADDTRAATCTTGTMTLEYACFNQHPSPRGHYYSTRELHARGIWVGYLAPGRQNKSYLGLPSYNELKANWRNFSRPFPPPYSGTLSGNREAVCRGCFGDQSQLITLREMPFVMNTSLVIMPLDGDDETGMFCIMLPQNLDRSMKTLQAWRPYERRNGGDGKSFDNTFMLLTLRNTNRDIGTIEAIRHVLEPREVTRAASASAPRNVVVLKYGGRVTSGPVKEVPQTRRTNNQECERSVAAEVNSQSNNKRKRLQSEAESRTCSEQIINANPLNEKDIPSDDAVSDAIHPTRAQQPITLSPIVSEAVPTVEVPLVDQPPCLSKLQAEKVRIIWKVDDDGMEYVLAHTMAQCGSFEKLLATLEDEVQAIPSIADLLKKTTWRLSYCNTMGAKKAVIVRRGTETAFDYLRDALTTSMPSAAEPDIMEIELKAMG